MRRRYELLAAVLAVVVVILVWVAPGLAQQGSAVSRLLGLDIETLTPTQADASGLLLTDGVHVKGASASGPAARADIRKGDAITHLDGKPMRTARDLEAALAARKPGETINIIRHRAEQAPRRLQVVLAGQGGAPAAALPDPVLMLDTGGHMAMVHRTEFTHDGRQLVVAGEDTGVRVWDATTGQTVRTFRGEVGVGDQGKIFSMALSPVDPMNREAGHKWVATGGWMTMPGRPYSHAVRLYDFQTTRLVRVLDGHNSVVIGMAFAPDGRRLLTGSGSGDLSAIIWDVNTGQILQRLRGHTGEIYDVAFSADGQRAVTGSFDNTVKLWDAGSGKLIANMTLHKDKIRSVAINPVDGTIASGSLDGEIRLWDGRTGNHIKLLVNQGGSIGRLVFSRDGQRLLSTCGYDGCGLTQRVYEIASGRQLLQFTKHDSIALGAAVSPDGQRIATVGGNRFQMLLWNFANGQSVRGPDGKDIVMAGTGRAKWAAGFSADGRSIAWGSTWRRADGGKGHSAETGSPLEFQMRLPFGEQRLGEPQPIAPKDAASASAWVRARTTSANGMSMVHRHGGSFGYEAFLDISQNGKTIRTIERTSSDGYSHRSYSFSPDGRTIMSGGNQGEMFAYGLDGKKLGQYEGHEGLIWALTPSPDGRLLLSSSNDQTVRLWNLATRELIVSMFHGTDGEWVMWTPQGYFTGSPNAGNIVGWQQNRGHDKEAGYVDAGTLRHVLRRHDIVERAIVLASSKAAVDELTRGGPTLAELVARPPPNIAIFGDDTTASGRARIVMEIERTGRPLTGFDVHLGSYDSAGRFLQERRLVHRNIPVPAGYTARYGDRDLQAVEVELRRGANALTVIARTDVGETISGSLDINSITDLVGDKAGTLRILAIGIDKYPNTGGTLKSLTLAGKDARDFAAIAEREMGRHHTDKVIEIMVNGAGGALEPTKANIEAALRRLSGEGQNDPARQKDTVVLFIAGHGESRRGQYVLLPTDFRRQSVADLGQNVVEWSIIRNAIASAPGRRAVFLDTCHSGNAHNDSVGLDSKSIKFAAFTAATGAAPAVEDVKLGNGRFTHAIKAGLTGAALSRSQITTLSLANFIDNHVKELSNGAQIADFFSGGGNFVLVQK